MSCVIAYAFVVTDPDVLAPVPKLDARALLAAVNGQQDLDLQFVDLAPGGQVGAAFVRWPDGHESVLTRGAGTLANIQRTSAVLNTLHSRGLPVPRYEVIAQVEGSIAIVQERLPGAPPASMTRDVLESMLGLLPQFEGVLAGHDDVPAPDLYLRHSGPGFSIHESLAAHSPRTQAVLRWIRDTGAHSPTHLTGPDLVHMDLHIENVLVDDAGAITGIVDWDGIGRGDRRFSLITMRLAALNQHADADTCTWLDTVMEDSFRSEQDRQLLRAYWAAMSLREIDWAIRHYPDERLDAILTLAESRMDLS